MSDYDVDVNIIVGKLAEKIARLEVDNAHMASLIDVLTAKLAETATEELTQE